MALQMDHTIHGVLVSGAYHKINYVAGNKDKLNIDVRVYKDATEAVDPNAYVDSFSFSMDSGDVIHDDGASDKNYTKQAYEHMKAGNFTDISGVVRNYSSASDV